MTQWNVYEEDLIGGTMVRRFIATTEADTASQACDFICRTQWISRHKLNAYPQETDPYTPKEKRKEA